MDDKLKYFKRITTETMLSDFNKVLPKTESNFPDMICRVDSNCRCCRNNCFKNASYKNMELEELLCWYHAYVKS